MEILRDSMEILRGSILNIRVESFGSNYVELLHSPGQSVILVHVCNLLCSKFLCTNNQELQTLRKLYFFSPPPGQIPEAGGGSESFERVSFFSKS